MKPLDETILPSELMPIRMSNNFFPDWNIVVENIAPCCSYDALAFAEPYKHML